MKSQNGKEIKIVAISDTHGRNHQIQSLINNDVSGDIFIHAGDFTTYNSKKHFSQFLSLMSKLKFEYKIVIPGNHQIILDASLTNQDLKGLGIFLIQDDMRRQKQIQRLKEANCLYYQHQYIEVKGIKLFLSAYTPISFYQKTGFQLDEEEMKIAWDGVPEDIDILVTHGPPHEILDKSMIGPNGNQNVGSKIIKQYLKKSKAKIHIFGHIHQSKGSVQVDGIKYYNVAEKINTIYVHQE